MAKKTFNVLANKQIRTEISLDNKANVSESRHIPTKFTKTNRVIYDSDWLDVVKKSDNPAFTQTGPNQDRNDPEPDQNPRAYGHINYFKNMTAQSAPTSEKNQEYPLEIFYSFNAEINIPNNLLGFARAQILIKTPADVKIKGVLPYDPATYGANFVSIKGDNKVIYQGFRQLLVGDTPGVFDSDITGGGVLQVNLGKWFIGKATESGLNGDFAYDNTRIVSAGSNYDFQLSPLDDGSNTRFDSKSFAVSALDAISTTSFTGTGNLTVSTWIHPGGNPLAFAIENVVTKNVTLTVPLIQGHQVNNGSSSFQIAGGTVTENNVTSTVNGVRSINPIGIGSSFTINVAHEVSDAFSPPEKRWRLFYSDKRARVVNFVVNQFTVGNSGVSNLPIATFYQGDILPYNQITFNVNQGEFPVLKAPDGSGINYQHGDKNEAWADMKPRSGGSTITFAGGIGNNLQQHRYLTQGTIQLSAPASNDVVSNSFLADQGEFKSIKNTYNSDGNTLIKQPDTETTKRRPLFIAADQVCQIKLVITLVNPTHINITEHHNV